MEPFCGSCIEAPGNFAAIAMHRESNDAMGLQHIPLHALG